MYFKIYQGRTVRARSTAAQQTALTGKNSALKISDFSLRLGKNLAARCQPCNKYASR
jgi:hypothetical protein